MKRFLIQVAIVSAVAAGTASVGAWLGSPVGMNQYLTTRDYQFSPESKERALLAANYTAKSSAIYAAVAALLGASIALAGTTLLVKPEEEQALAFARKQLQDRSLPPAEAAVWMEAIATLEQKQKSQ